MAGLDLGLRNFGPPFQCFVASRFDFPVNSCVDEGTVISMNIVIFGFLLRKMAPCKVYDKTGTFFHIAHRRTSLTHGTNPRPTASFSSNHKLTRILRATWCVAQKNASPWSEWPPKASAARRSRRRLVCRCRQRDGDMVSCDIGQPRGEEAGSCLVFLVFVGSHLSNCV